MRQSKIYYSNKFESQIANSSRKNFFFHIRRTRLLDLKICAICEKSMDQITVTIFPHTCQNPDPPDSNWRELNVPSARDMQECMRACAQNKHALGFQYNGHDKFCGCLSVAPGKTIDEIIDGKNVFKGTCTIGAFRRSKLSLGF